MSLTRRTASFIILVSIAASHAAAQTKPAPLNQSDPFTIRSGSTFSASGGTPRPETDPGESSEKPSRIAADIREAQEIIAKRYIAGRTVNSDDLTKAALDGMLRSLDPHSNFYDSDEWREMLDEQRSGYTGIGATIANFERSGIADTYILSTFPSSPAAKSQLKYGDRIVAINGEKMSGKDSDVVRDKIRGATGTTFRLTVERSATNRLETIEIRRNRVPQPSIPDAYMLRPGIGYIELSEGFNYTTSAEFDAALAALKRVGLKYRVPDLRNNGRRICR